MIIDKEKFYDLAGSRFISSSLDIIKTTLAECEIKPVDCKDCAINESNNVLTCMGCIHNTDLEDNFKLKPRPWWEDKNNFPVLCWVSDGNSDPYKVAQVMTGYKKSDDIIFVGDGVNWRYATPVTKEDINKYIMGKDNE